MMKNIILFGHARWVGLTVLQSVKSSLNICEWFQLSHRCYSLLIPQSCFCCHLDRLTMKVYM